MSLSIGQQLQNWLIRNQIDVTHVLFVAAVDHAIANATRRDQAPSVNRRATSSIPASPSGEDGLAAASMAI